jgi:hypothetical protein
MRLGLFSPLMLTIPLALDVSFLTEVLSQYLPSLCYALRVVQWVAGGETGCGFAIEEDGWTLA